MQTTITRDSSYRVERLETGPGLIDRSYGYGFTGNIGSITTNAADTLPEPQITAGAQQFLYTPNTNKLSEIDLLSGVGQNRSYLYDNNGNTLSDGTRTFTWNQDNRLISVDNAGAVSNYTYNGKGQRVKKVAAGSTTIYHYDLQGNLIEETNGSGTLIADYVYDGSNRIAMVKPDNSIYYYHNDHLGTPLAMTDQAGQVVWSAAYMPFGEAVVATETVKNNFRFPGQYCDEETGLHYNWNRYYDPSTGRYLSSDPIGVDDDEINLYLYVYNNPINWIDPKGLFHYKPGVPPAGPITEQNLKCMDNCLKMDLGISGGGECTKPHKIDDKTRGHCAGKAADISYRMNYGIENKVKEVMCCVKKCGFKYAKIEKDHFHVQTHSDLNGRSGALSDISDCDCK